MTPAPLPGVRPQLYRVDRLLEVHDGLAGRVRRFGPEVVLLERGWRRDRWCWRLYGMHRSLEAALAEEVRRDLRRWLRERGWRDLPDGSAISRPRTDGLVEAAKVERALLLRGTEIAA